MKHLLLTLNLFICLISYVFAQPAIPDSVRKDLQKHANNLEFKLSQGIKNLKTGNHDLAEALLTETASEAFKKNDFQVFINAEMNIGKIYSDKGQNVKALHHYQIALNKAEQIKDDKHAAHLLKYIGALYISWKKFDEALGYYERAESIASRINDEELIADCQNNKGTVYEQQTKYDKAINAYKSALEVYTRKNIPGKISMALSNVAIVYKYQKNYAASLAYNLKALALSVKENDKWIMSATYNNIGNLYGEMGEYKKALVYCEKSIAIAKQINALEIIESAYDSMADAAAKARDYKSAFEYHKLFSTTNNRFINIESTKQLSELNIKYETEKRQKLIQQQQFEISKKNYWIYGSFILFFLGLLVAYLIFRNYRYKQQQRLQEEVYKQQEIATRSLFEGEQTERIRLARDLHDSIGQMLSVIKMNLSSLDHQYQQEKVISSTSALVDKTINEVRYISHNLIPEELNFGLFTAIEELCEKINLGGAIHINTAIPAASTSRYAFEKTSELSIYRVVQEILGNMVNHAQATVIKLSITETDAGLKITLQDNGKGFDVDQIHQSKGIGWKNIAARINFLDGKMKLTSKQSTGTQIEITLPKS